MSEKKHLNARVSFLELNNSVKFYFDFKKKYFFIEALLEKKIEDSFFLHINKLVSKKHTPVKILPRVDISHNSNSFFRVTTENIKYEKSMEMIFISKKDTDKITHYQINIFSEHIEVKTISNNFINFNIDYQKINISKLDYLKTCIFKYFFRLSKKNFFCINEIRKSKILNFKIILSLITSILFSFKNFIYSKNNKFIKKSDTLAIIGSGPSINRLNKSDLDFINQSDTIGINFAYMTKFKLDALVLETADISRDFIFETLHPYLNGENQPIVFIWDEWIYKFDLYSNLHRFPKISVWSSYSFFGKNLENFKYLISHFYKFFSKFNFPIYPLYAPLSIGIKHRYKEIRLYGFDSIEPGNWYDKKACKYQKNLLSIRDQFVQNIFPKNFKNPTSKHSSIVKEVAGPLKQLTRLEIFEGLKIWAVKNNVKIAFKNNSKKNPLHNIFDSID